jgi:glutathione synthase/RimK-type ligase-like ATP-grasp enzyme
VGIKVAYLTGASYRGKAMQGLPPAEEADFAILAPAAAAEGIDFEIVRWDTPKLPTRGFAAALIRSTWDYTERRDEFVSALERLELSGLRVLNPTSVVRWNSRKTYLQELARAGAPVIPTLWPDELAVSDVVKAFEAFDAAELVVKPQVGAGSRDTLRLARNGWSAADLALGPRGPAMIQPFLPSIQTAGETSLFFFGGALGHVVRKFPAAESWYANTAGAVFKRSEADPAELHVAQAALAAAPKDMLYVRVDLVRGSDDRPAVIELEAIEPYLFFDFAPEGAPVFARALALALRG